jgi:hypothetical protein
MRWLRREMMRDIEARPLGYLRDVEGQLLRELEFDLGALSAYEDGLESGKATHPRAEPLPESDYHKRLKENVKEDEAHLKRVRALIKAKEGTEG